MELQQNFKCKTCGLPLDSLAALSTNGLVECTSCFNVWTIPKKETSPAALQFLRMGEHDLDIGKFDDALTAYSKAAQLDPTEPEAYFGMALSEFKVRYLFDHENKRWQPICYEITDKKFTESSSYQKVYDNATVEQRTEYARKGREIDYILGEFYKLQQSGKRYDCFICVKVTIPGTKLPTEDSKDADYIYRLLQDKGYKPFYSERELRNLTGADYEARIMYALYTSECMLVVCQNEEYLQTPWVKNEYTRFLKLVNDEEKESDSITFVFNGDPIEKLPGRAGKIQGINFALRQADGKIIEFVDAHTPESRRRREAEQRRKSEQEQVILKQIEEQKRVAEEQQKAQRELEERLSQLQTTNVSAPAGATATVKSLLQRAQQELDTGDRAKAKDYYVRVLDIEPDCSEAWWGLFLLDMNVTSEGTIIKNITPQSPKEIQANRNYRNAVNYAKGEMANRIDAFKNTVFGGELWWSRLLRDYGHEANAAHFDVEKIEDYDALQAVRTNPDLLLAKKYASGALARNIEEFEMQLCDKISQVFLPCEEQTCRDLEKKREDKISKKDAYVAKMQQEIKDKEAQRALLIQKEDELTLREKKLKKKANFGIVDTWFWYTLFVPFVFAMILVYLILIAPILAIVRGQYRKKLDECKRALNAVSAERRALSVKVNQLVIDRENCISTTTNAVSVFRNQMDAANEKIATMKDVLKTGKLINAG